MSVKETYTSQSPHRRNTANILYTNKIINILEGMEKLGYGQGYLYPHDYPGNYVEQQYLPEKIKDKKYYVPGENDKLKINPQKLEQKEKSKKQ